MVLPLKIGLKHQEVSKEPIRSKAMPKPKSNFVKKLTYSPIPGSAVKSFPPKFIKKAKPNGTTT